MSKHRRCSSGSAASPCELPTVVIEVLVRPPAIPLSLRRICKLLYQVFGRNCQSSLLTGLFLLKLSQHTSNKTIACSRRCGIRACADQARVILVLEVFQCRSALVGGIILILFLASFVASARRPIRANGVYDATRRLLLRRFHDFICQRICCLTRLERKTHQIVNRSVPWRGKKLHQFGARHKWHTASCCSGRYRENMHTEDNDTSSRDGPSHIVRQHAQGITLGTLGIKLKIINRPPDSLRLCLVRS